MERVKISCIPLPTDRSGNLLHAQSFAALSIRSLKLCGPEMSCQTFSYSEQEGEVEQLNTGTLLYLLIHTNF